MAEELDRLVRERLATDGPDAAVTALIEALGPAILRYLRSMLRVEEDADDAFSQWAESVWRGLAAFRGESSLKTWGYRLAWNAAEQRLTSGKASVLVVERPRQRQALEKLRAALSEEDRSLLVLPLDQQHSWNEAGHPMPPTSEAAVRAAHLIDDLKCLSALGPVDEARVRAQLSPASVKAIEESLSTSYLPLALKVELAETVCRVAGEAGSRRWGTASFLASIEGFFKPLFVGLTRLVDPSPTLVLKTFPKGWTTTYRGCGEFQVSQPAPGQTRLLCRGIAPAMLSPACLAAVCGTLAGAFEVSSYAGTVKVEPRPAGSGEASWLVEWWMVERK